MHKWIKYGEELINANYIQMVNTSEDYYINISYINGSKSIYYKSKERRDDDFYAIVIFLPNHNRSYLELSGELQ